MATYFWVGGSGTWDNVSTTNWAATSGGAGGAGVPNSADVANFDANSGTAAVVSVASTAVANTVNINKSDINLSLTGSCTLGLTGIFTFTAGTITLNNFTLTVLYFSSNNANTRAIAFGTGAINATAGNGGAAWVMATTTGFSYTGTPTVNLAYAGAGTGGRSVSHGVTGGTEANAVSFNTINSTVDPVFFVNGSRAKNINFSSLNAVINYGPSSYFIYGNLVGGAGNVVTNGTTITFAATSGTQQITTGGATYDIGITQNGVGGTVQLQDNLTMGSTRTFTLTNGALDLSSGNRTLSTGLFASNNSNVRSILFGTGNITITGSGTVWNTATPTNFTYTGTPTVNISNNSATAATVSTGAMTEAQSLNFNYTTGTYTLTDTAAVYRSVNFTGFAGTIPNSVRTIFGSLTLSTGMTLTAGANPTTFSSTSAGNTITNAGKTQDYPLIFNGIGGTFAFQDALTQGSTRAFTVTNGTVELKNGVTSTVGAFATSGTNQKFLQSTLAGSQATLSQASGTVDASYLTIQDINAVGGATWNAFVNQQNIDAGNNDGWDFGISPIVGSYEYTYQLRSFTQPRRF